MTITEIPAAEQLDVTPAVLKTSVPVDRRAYLSGLLDETIRDTSQIAELAGECSEVGMRACDTVALLGAFKEAIASCDELFDGTAPRREPRYPGLGDDDEPSIFLGGGALRAAVSVRIFEAVIDMRYIEDLLRVEPSVAARARAIRSELMAIAKLAARAEDLRR